MNNQAVAIVGAPYAPILAAIEDRFTAVAGKVGLDWQTEALFALQACQKNPLLGLVAKSNPLSLQMAMLNVAAVGLTLNPALSLAFLIPRKNEVVLDVSYRGLIKIATDTGSILWAKAELVFQADRFEYRGPATAPLHRCDPFARNRGEMRGGYCIAKTKDEEFLVEVMSAEEIYQVRAMSDSYKAHLQNGKSCPWTAWPGEQAKKVLIKRAYKTWPKTSRRLAETIQYLNEKLGEGVDAPVLAETPEETSEAPSDDALDDDRIAASIKVMVTKVIGRAKSTGSWEAAREYLATKVSGPELIWARKELERAADKPSTGGPAA